MAELDDVKKAAIAAAISAYLSDAGAAMPFRPGMFLRDVKGAGAWGSVSREAMGFSGYRKDNATRLRQFFGNDRA